MAAILFHDCSHMHESFSKESIDTSYGRDDAIIQPSNKGAPSQTTPQSQAAFIPLSTDASSGTSTTESLSELTSHSSLAGRGETTPQNRAQNYRRSKPGKSNARWSRGGGSSESQPSCKSPSLLPRQPPPPSNLMATTFGSPSGDSRRGVVSPRPKGRGTEAKNTFCRNVTIYGHCRYENSKYWSPCLPNAVVTPSSLSLHPRSCQVEPEREREEALQRRLPVLHASIHGSQWISDARCSQRCHLAQSCQCCSVYSEVATIWWVFQCPPNDRY